MDESCIGVKTGFTDNAKRCLVSATEKDSMQIISVVLNCQPMFEECMRLDSMAYGEYMMKEFVQPYNYVGTSFVEGGDKKEIGLATVSGYSEVIKKADEDKYRVVYDIPCNLVAPLQLNQPVGSVKVYYMENIVFESPLYTIDSIKNIDLRHKIDSIIEKWF
jgi:D-alanyl-D-alanine carboxypeptidase